jgi:hypothetical protein
MSRCPEGVDATLCSLPLFPPCCRAALRSRDYIRTAISIQHLHCMAALSRPNDAAPARPRRAVLGAGRRVLGARSWLPSPSSITPSPCPSSSPLPFPILSTLPLPAIYCSLSDYT